MGRVQIVPWFQGVAVATPELRNVMRRSSATYENELDNLSVTINPVPPTCTDQDGDGFGSPGDPSCDAGSAENCDDLDASRFPGAAEICNGIDDDCDGSRGPEEVDEDRDGFFICENDCDDGDPSLNPDATEINFNFVDENCDGRFGLLHIPTRCWPTRQLDQ